MKAGPDKMGWGEEEEEEELRHKSRDSEIRHTYKEEE